MSKKTSIALLLSAMTLAGIISGCSGDTSGSSADSDSISASNVQSSDAGDISSASSEEAELPENFNPTGYPIVNEKITLKLVGQTHPNLVSDWSQSDFFIRMEEKTNIAFDFYTIPNTAWNEKFNLIFASEDLPDVFFKTNINLSDISTYYNQGYLIDLAPLIEQYGDNLKEYLKNDSFKTAVTLPGGQIPTLAQQDQVIPRSPLWLNNVWMEKLNLDMPTNADELYNVLKAFKEQDPNGNGKADEIPLCLGDDSGGIGQLELLMAYFGLYFANDGSDMFVDPATGELVYAPETDQYRDALRFFKKLYDEQLLDNEVFTQKQAQVKAKGTEAEPRLGGIITTSPLLEVGAERHFDYTIVTPPVAPNGVQAWTMLNEFTPGKFAITNQNQYPEATLRWIDSLYCEEGGQLVWMGVENEDFKMNDDGSWDWILCESDGGDVKAHRAHVGMQPGGNSPSAFPELWNHTTNAQEKHLIENRGKVKEYLIQPLPVIYYERDDAKQLTTLSSDLDTYISQAVAQFVTGEMSLEEDWDNYVATLKQMGSEDLKALVTRNYEAIQ